DIMVEEMSPTLPTRTRYLPGAMIRSMTATQRPRRSEHSHLEPARLELKIWLATFGNGVRIITRRHPVERKSIQPVQPAARAGSIVAEAGNPVSAACGRQRAAQMYRRFRATILAFASSANASKSPGTPGFRQ